MEQTQVTKKKNNSLINSIIFKIIAFVGLLLPEIILVLVKKDDYFVTSEETVKITIGGILAAAFTVLALLKKLKGLNGAVTLGIIWVICFLLKSLVDDILIIIPVVLIGYILYFIFDKISIYYRDIYKVERNAKIDYKAREQAKNEIQEETTGW